MTITKYSTSTAPAANPAPWHSFAADYRASLASYEARIKGDDDDGAPHEQHEPLYRALLAYPVTTPHQLAEKAELLIADCWDDGAALGVIAADTLIVAHADQSRRAPWDAALAAYEAADAALDAVTAAEEHNGEESTEEWGAAYGARADALTALLDTRAPDGVAMGIKARLVLRQEHEGFIDENADDPATVSQWLASNSWDEHGFAAIYQDGLALAGGASAIIDATADAFDPESWLEQVEARTGSALLPSGQWGNMAFSGGDKGAANTALSALRLAQQEDVRVHASKRSAGADA